MMTEAEALTNILTWSAGCPNWQRDALRRLATHGDVDASEIGELVAISKGNSPSVPLEEEHLRGLNRNEGEVCLHQVHDVHHVNALASDQRLTFHRRGLTIVYGDNGSGKSSYARILKKVCRARMSRQSEEITPDIYDPSPGTPRATIEYTVGGQNKISKWQRDQSADATLSAVSVFDSRTATVHVDEANNVAYTPFPLKLLGSLARLCNAVKEGLVSEITQLQEQTPQSLKSSACSANSKVGQLLTRLSTAGAPASVEKLAKLTRVEQDRLAQLSADLAGDPSRAARQLSALKTKVESHIARLDQLFATINDANATELRRLAIQSAVSRGAAEAASGELFADEPLAGIGSEVWQALWKSAQAYSVESAYPEKNFPVTAPGSVCVLCQQELSPQAAERLNRFEAFVRDDSQKRADVARNAYDTAVADFMQSGLTVTELATIVATIRDDLNQDALAGEIRKAGLHALWRYRQIKRFHVNPAVAINIKEAAWPRQILFEQITDLEVRSEALMAEADSSARAALVAEHVELADRQWLKGIKADVLAEIERLKQIKALEKAKKDTGTKRITIKSTEIANALVTDALRARFAHEVASFEIAGLAVELCQQSSVQGVPRFKVALTRKPTALVGQVLSEGEYRCVALAAFMAELATIGNRSCIVFDDPVSSLDHMHRAAVAKRLIAEAANRQVIVFTHDLAFLFELNRAADEVQPKPQVAISSVSRGSDKAGFCRNEAPFKARRVCDITSSLMRKLSNEVYHFEQGDQDSWRETVKSIAALLRDTWEIAVEEVVGHVIRRLSNEVKTPGLVKLTAITIADCEAMREGFQQCSELLHSASALLNRPLPRPEVLAEKISALAAWSESLRNRQNTTKLH
ncbi:MAG: AAA family ATPase [Acetobacter malorum]|uniref:AAA family ATPase n=1 Tax=Acetobacter malorum TaxID=178901 RepID=UPI0039EC6C11